jgi:ribonuclease HII
LSQIIGVDEVGRGPLAGPVLACAVILNPQKRINGLKDSKMLTEAQRNKLSARIRERAIGWSFGLASVVEIDRYNILQASMLAMSRAVAALKVKGNYQVLVDGNRCPKVNFPVEAIVGGDSLITEISAASIVAKVIRDYLMTVFDKKYPQYGWAQNKGYGTKAHLTALAKYGASPLHRRSFAPVKEALEL